jgi:hypothetical protein
MACTEFQPSLLRAIDRWQKGGDRAAKARRGKRLKDEVLALNDAVVRECKRVVYRRLALPQSDIWKFLTTGRLPETISAWTLDDDIAKGIKGGIPEEWRDAQRWFGLIICHQPYPDEVIANLETLWVDLDYQRALRDAGLDKYTEGIRRYENSQREVVLEISEFSLDEIWSWGGYSSSVEDFAALVFGADPTKEQVDWFRSLLEEHKIQTGARRTTPSGARNITRRVLEHARQKCFPVPDEPTLMGS